MLFESCQQQAVEAQKGQGGRFGNAQHLDKKGIIVEGLVVERHIIKSLKAAASEKNHAQIIAVVPLFYILRSMFPPAKGNCFWTTMSSLRLTT